MSNQQNTIWNLPENMPTDVPFLADVGAKFPVMATWNDANEWYQTCTVTMDNGPYFADYSANEIKGWLPLPSTEKQTENL